MPKYQEYYQQMVDENLDLFGKFQDLHDKYALNKSQWQVEYNQVGGQIIEIIREWERKLCRECEKGQFGKFSSKLADKFWELVRKDFPRIDFVGAS